MILDRLLPRRRRRRPHTWPQALTDLVRQLADDGRSAGHEPESDQDLPLSKHEEVVLRHLDGKLVRARHGTRLLDHEKKEITAKGLRLLNAELVNDRLDQAHTPGYLTATEHQVLRAKNCTVPEHRGPGRREVQVCLTLSTAAMAHHSQGLHRLLSYWGGEAICWQHCESDQELAAKLRSLGSPSIVTALLDLTAPSAGPHFVYPAMVHLLVGKALGW
ncbi:hypothetical protein ABZY81_37930 [Streptomyces sp. NPDC006514]|uniref:hypothetical protein n=1 Tax=Streptomyces sp. NPDC006514 TaxID=3154308 RepID=UPI00339F6B66